MASCCSTQAVVLVLMFWIAADFARGSGFWVQPLPRLGRVVLVWSYLYAGAMVVRYVDQDGAEARPALARRHDSDHLPRGPGRPSSGRSRSITQGSRDLRARLAAASLEML